MTTTFIYSNNFSTSPTTSQRWRNSTLFFFSFSFLPVNRSNQSQITKSNARSYFLSIVKLLPWPFIDPNNYVINLNIISVDVTWWMYRISFNFNLMVYITIINFYPLGLYHYHSNSCPLWYFGFRFSVGQTWEQHLVEQFGLLNFLKKIKKVLFRSFESLILKINSSDFRSILLFILKKSWNMSYWYSRSMIQIASKILFLCLPSKLSVFL